MRIVSENSAADLEKNAALSEIERCLRSLTSNLLRVARGGGRPSEIGLHAQNLINAMVAHQDASGGRDPFPEQLAAFLRIRTEHDLKAKLDDENLEEVEAEDLIVRGALQIAASRLVRQLTQERAGDSEMYEGINRLHALREKQRKEYRAALRISGAATPPPRRKRKQPRVWTKPPSTD